MGEHFEKDSDYKNAADFEKAMNMCEIQQFKYLIYFLEKVGGAKIIEAIRNKKNEAQQSRL